MEEDDIACRSLLQSKITNQQSSIINLLQGAIGPSAACR
jgi:hypothetical protein